MPTIRNRYVEALHGAVVAYVRAIEVPDFDEIAVAARRERHRGTATVKRRPLLRTAALAAAAVFAIVLACDRSAVVAGMQRVFAAFAVTRGRTVPLNVREVDLAQARADRSFEIIVPPSLPGTRLTLREITSPASPADDSVAFDIRAGRSGSQISIVDSRDASGPHELYLSAREPDRGDAMIAPLGALPKLARSARPRLSIVGNVGKGPFVPLTWVARGTRIVLMSPPGMLFGAQMRAIRSKDVVLIPRACHMSRGRVAIMQ